MCARSEVYRPYPPPRDCQEEKTENFERTENAEGTERTEPAEKTEKPKYYSGTSSNEPQRMLGASGERSMYFKVERLWRGRTS